MTPSLGATYRRQERKRARRRTRTVVISEMCQERGSPVGAHRGTSWIVVGGLRTAAQQFPGFGPGRKRWRQSRGSKLGATAVSSMPRDMGLSSGRLLPIPNRLQLFVSSHPVSHLRHNNLAIFPTQHTLPAQLSHNFASVGVASLFHSGAHRHYKLSKSPFQTFVGVFKHEPRKNRDFC